LYWNPDPDILRVGLLDGGEDMADDGAEDGGTSVFVAATDGLKLHVREYGTRTAPGVSVVCLPGFTRTAADFAALAPALAGGPPQRRVIVIDSRGRGRSEYDSNPANYNLIVELSDVMNVLIALAVRPAVFIGTSRGGLLSMLLGASEPTMIAGVVFNDVGPVIEPKGLARIKSTVGNLPQPRSLQDGAEILRRLMAPHFPKLTADQWLGYAQQTWQVKNGAVVPFYDPRLARVFAGFDIERRLPTLWNEFDTLAHVPMLVIRGANSDLLSAATVTAMRERRKKMEWFEVPDQGHAPLLEGDDIISRISQFVTTCELDAAKKPTAPATASLAM
jgi:pimeloyl-ACP methyl ester carboxylesterase